MTGVNGGRLKEMCDQCFCAPSSNTPCIREVHITVGYIICEIVRQAYGFQLDKKKLEELEGVFGKTWKRFSRGIRKFCRFLEGKEG